jgi:16S rRNA (cytidine1402-2'-O)-methyltransferase
LPLLTNLGIKSRLQALHAHNEHDKSEALVAQLEQGITMALISDAGTPLISDPGFPLVELARKKNILVVPIPGCCALITALSAAGVPCDSFSFLGFLPAKEQARQSKLNEYKHHAQTLVFYESTHRIVAALDDIALCYGVECHVVLAKELTKTFERFIAGTPNVIRDWLLSDPSHSKGEFVLIIPPRAMIPDQDEDEKILALLLEELPLKQAVKIAAKLTHRNKNELYRKALNLTS